MRVFFAVTGISISCLFFFFLAHSVHKDLTRQGKINIILITVENLRDDNVTQKSSPNLVKAAQQGVRYTQHRANSGWTGANIESLLSGLTLFETGVHTHDHSITPELNLPLEQLAESSYTANGIQPFTTMDTYQNLAISIDSSSPDPLIWLARKKKEQSPFFLWYHYIPTRLPDTRKKSPVVHQLQQYNIQEFDLWFEKLWQLYALGGLFRNSILIVTADLGDKPGKKRMMGHASTTVEGDLHEEIVHVPFFIWLPKDVTPKSSPVNLLTAYIDALPTLMQFVGIQPQHQIQNTSILIKNMARNLEGTTSIYNFTEPDSTAKRYFDYSFLEGEWNN